MIYAKNKFHRIVEMEASQLVIQSIPCPHTYSMAKGIGFSQLTRNKVENKIKFLYFAACCEPTRHHYNCPEGRFEEAILFALLD